MPKNNPRIILTHAYSSKNAGDAAIVSSMIAQIRNLYSDAIISIATWEDPVGTPFFEGAQQYRSICGSCGHEARQGFYGNFRALGLLLSAGVWVIVYKFLKYEIRNYLPAQIVKIMRAYANADLIIAVGGGYLIGKRQTLKGFLVHLIKLFEIYIGPALHKPTVLYSQSIGPFEQILVKKITAHTLNKASLILAREQYTYDFLLRLGLSPEKVARGKDSAFLFSPTTEALPATVQGVIQKCNSKTIIGLTVRQCYLDGRQLVYEKNIADFITYLNTLGYVTLCIPDVSAVEFNDDDRVVQRRIQQHVKDKSGDAIFIDEAMSSSDVFQTLGMCSFVVSTRMHGAIFALSQTIPVIAIAYELKTNGVMEDLGFERWVIDVNALTLGALIKLITECMEGADDYKSKLKLSIPDYKIAAQNDMRVALSYML